jgi:hypothetical protein
MEVVDFMGNGGFTANSAAAVYDELEISIERCRRNTNKAPNELARRSDL